MIGLKHLPLTKLLKTFTSDREDDPFHPEAAGVDLRLDLIVPGSTPGPQNFGNVSDRIFTFV